MIRTIGNFGVAARRGRHIHVILNRFSSVSEHVTRVSSVIGHVIVSRNTTVSLLYAVPNVSQHLTVAVVSRVNASVSRFNSSGHLYR